MQGERAEKFGVFWQVVCQVDGSVAGTQGSNSQSSQGCQRLTASQPAARKSHYILQTKVVSGLKNSCPTFHPQTQLL